MREEKAEKEADVSTAIGHDGAGDSPSKVRFKVKGVLLHCFLT